MVCSNVGSLIEVIGIYLPVVWYLVRDVPSVSCCGDDVHAGDSDFPQLMSHADNN